MKKLTFALSALAALFSLSANAVPLTSAASISSGGLTFDSFGCTHTASNPAFTGGSCGTIDVAGFGAGLTFTGGLSAFGDGSPSGVSNDFLITYHANASPATINSLGLLFNGQVSGSGFGFAEVVEQAFGNAGRTVFLGQTNVTTVGSEIASLAINPARTDLWLTKDIQLFVAGQQGRPGQTTATVSLVDQTFNTSNRVPEPASLAILGTALVGAGVLRRRRLNSKA